MPYIIIFQDYFTEYIEAALIPDTSAATIHNEVLKELRASEAASKKRFDEKAHAGEYTVGDLVLLRCEKRKISICSCEPVPHAEACAVNVPILIQFCPLTTELCKPIGISTTMTSIANELSDFCTLTIISRQLSIVWRQPFTL
uniref:Uncharacterized protein n=1 Tax=Romanomermis culicivorax TaxID=13658 RepID=A0A915KXU6_ROMCU